MASTNGVNLIVAQGSKVIEVQNIRKQVLELGQQAIAQQSEEKKKEEKSKVQKFQEGDRVEIRTEEERQEGRGQGKEKNKDRSSETGGDKPVSSPGNLIDIKV
jgi:hypothetical protein